MRKHKLFLAALVAGLLGLTAPGIAEPVKVFAAASLKTALDEVAANWNAKTGKTAVMVYAGSPALAKQIASGAPADIFISADLAWMDELQNQGLIQNQTRANLLGNNLVLIAPADAKVNVDFGKPIDLQSLLAGGKLAVADVNAVPAGRYAKAALEHFSLWQDIQSSLAQTENVRAALALVARGEAPLGIVYGSDAKAEPAVRVIAEFPANSHPAITYPVALTKGARSTDATDFLNYLHANQAKSVFVKYGFTAIP